jgi:tRNA(Ile)-lysidine synthetase-like protein
MAFFIDYMLSHYKPNIDSDNFILAVSGGVDSVVLLDILSKMNYGFVVAHYDHGIRKDSDQDRLFVEKIANKYGKAFFYAEGNLGSEASEELARNKRYEFFKDIQNKTGANLIVTAHHQDDEIETAIINIIRGTSRLGLSSIANNQYLARPLVNYPKAELIEYAKNNNLQWVEDATNSDPHYLRNKVRLQIIPKMPENERRVFLEHIKKSKDYNKKIEPLLINLSNRVQHKGKPVISRQKFILLDDTIARELVHHLLRTFRYKNYDKKNIDRIVIGIKTLKAGKVIEVPGGKIILTKRSARFYL